ncbi:nucleoside phosphorylase domain-containing protein [Aspergillus spectabilis]
MAAAQAMLDEDHQSLPNDATDANHYVLGKMHALNIVLVCLPNNIYGTTSAAVVATHMLYAFTRIRIALMVGIGGGVTCTSADIRLGDFVVSSPRGQFGGFVQHSLGKNNGQDIEITGMLNKQPQALMTAVADVHYGLIASGNQVTKHGTTRDRLASKLGVLCFDMEAAGVMDNYADSHKRKLWQGYSAAAAAAYAPDLLSVLSDVGFDNLPTVAASDMMS